MTSSKVTGSSFLKTLGLEEEPHLLVPLVSAMSGVEQLQTLAENMSAVLRSKQGTATCSCMVAPRLSEPHLSKLIREAFFGDN